MDSTRLYSDSEFLAEHMGFLPERVMDEIYDTTNKVVYEAMKGMRLYFESLPGIDIAALSEKNCNFFFKKRFSYCQNWKVYDKRVETEIDCAHTELQKYVVGNVLRLPTSLHITLDHYKDLDLDSTEEDEVDLNKQLEKARKDLLTQKAFKNRLIIEEKQVDDQMTALEKHKRAYGFLSKMPQEGDVWPINDAMRMVTENVRALNQAIYRVLERISMDGSMDRLVRPDERTLYLRRVVKEKIDDFQNTMSDLRNSLPRV
ncbi:hypothetical protein PHYBLDRAFT_170243 [Phycomyces blakesleeanus NRRL 1555(-)]|uniref:Uncharacterized protein n=1 Tax=Phycomyces blakesleeanus (strain ATCC 8743b / DSM 1359 / FGSC 10004 / NBRC 33097 / NRRL 1555) TaxID=763407 RepID=A0A162TWQ9_PHYB8|nr:hypothetical protein PHYBLDRAFT_170243 [Phycomyces blakesleeanus NRRL 1555(-)]OAD71582.1 hypothetical protein PHYBLDRAFT_170243 [Phycomyces blakesleeanus NRRL 1555(-)]|eukprot:XP_018289622.1 hypothetical protein PHYBLDRAFT_170243 [Phycomyces blakesleeanus NRRL 1555(-)]